MPAHRSIDMRGLVCPAPVLMTRTALRNLKKGEILEIVSNDDTIRDQITGISMEAGCTVCGCREEGGLYFFTLRK